MSNNFADFPWLTRFTSSNVTSVDGPDMMTSSNGNIFRVTGLCAGNSPVPGELPAQRPVTRSFDVFFDLRLNKRLSKKSWGWWFETLSRSLWRHCNLSLSSTHLAIYSHPSPTHIQDIYNSRMVFINVLCAPSLLGVGFKKGLWVIKEIC